MPMRMRRKEFFIGSGIAPQRQYILYPQKVQVYQRILGFFLAETAAYKMGNSLYLILVHDGSTNTYSARAFAYLYPFKMAINPFFIDLLRPVVCYIYECRLELHKGIKMTIDRINAFTL